MKALIDFGASDLAEAAFDFASFESELSQYCSALVLDRGVFNPFASLPTLAFPRYSQHRFNAADSCLLHEIASDHEIDLFIGFGNTTPLSIPMIQVIVGAPILEPTPRLSKRQRDEWDIALHFAQMIVLGPAIDSRRFVTSFPSVVEKLVPDIAACMHKLTTKGDGLRAAAFFEEWSRLRRLQASVDFVMWDPK